MRSRSLAALSKGLSAKTAVQSVGWRSLSTNKLKDDFYRVSEFNPATTAAANNSIVGEIIDHAIDLTKARPGETIEVPYEVKPSHKRQQSSCYLLLSIVGYHLRLFSGLLAICVLFS